MFANTRSGDAGERSTRRYTAIAPDLTDAQRLNIDGSYAAIVSLVRSGVPKPKQHAAPIPALDGAASSGPQVCAVAAYVYSLGHR